MEMTRSTLTVRRLKNGPASGFRCNGQLRKVTLASPLPSSAPANAAQSGLKRPAVAAFREALKEQSRESVPLGRGPLDGFVRGWLGSQRTGLIQGDCTGWEAVG